MRKWIVLIGMMMLALLVSACGGTKEYEPVAINEETDRCEICNMAVTDNQFATQVITNDGQPYKFDDIGCMYEWFERNGTEDVGIAFVRDYHSQAWLKLEEAYYVYGEDLSTPMAYGVVSFADEAAAQAFISEHGTGTLMTSEELAKHSWESHGHDHGHDHDHDAHAHAEHSEQDHAADTDHHAEAGHHG